jgi:RNA polymerase sigma-70 factor, ECF subfamily
VEAEDGLIARTLAGDLEAYAALVDRYRAAVFSLAYRMTGSRDRADDLAQDAFLRAYNALDSFDRQRPFRPWMLTIAANLCKEDLRRRARSGEEELPEELPAVGSGNADDPYGTAQRKETQVMVHRALGRLPDTQRLVTILVYLQGLSLEQVSEMLGQPVNTVKSHAHRARARLRQLLAPHAEVTA